MAALAIFVILIVQLLRTQGAEPKMIQFHLAPDETFSQVGACHA
ncbi:MAG: hypothetical protein OXN89_19385 [Bryobacterales bacterium]|nr:hypothetical protein [Bryobacterales bacterium]